MEQEIITKSRRLPLEAWGRRWLAWLEARAGKSAAGRFLFEFLMFGIKQAWACLFGGIMVALVFGTHYLWPRDAPLARYDFLVLAAVAVQAAMLGFRLESWNEAKVIFAFHVTGTVMELFKIQAGSWIYPEPGILRIGMVPLFSGFMYAAVGSYLARVWRIFDFRFSHYPPVWTTVLLALAIYVNFFTHHWWPDVRLGLFAVTAAAISADLGVLPTRPDGAAHAAAAGLFPGGAVHLVRGKSRHLLPDLDVSQPAWRLGDCLADQAGKLVSADDYQLCDGVAGAAAAGAGTR